MANTENAQLTGEPQVRCDDWLADIERTIIQAYETGYINGHNDERDGMFDTDTNHQARTHAKGIFEALKKHMSANGKL